MAVEREQTVQKNLQTYSQNRSARNRNRLKNRCSLISMLILGVGFFLTALLLVVLPRPTESLIEQRELATFPEFSLEKYFSGEFTAEIASCYDDTVPNRDNFKNLGNQFKGIFGIPTTQEVIIGGNKRPQVVQPSGDKPADNGQSQSSSSSEPSESSTPEQGAGRLPENGGEEEPSQSEPSGRPEEPDQTDYTQQDADGNYENGILIVNQDGHWRGMELFGGGSGNAYVEGLNDLQSKVGDGVTIYSMPAPLASEFYLPSNFSEYSTSQAACFQSIAQRLDSRIRSVDICSVLAKHTEEPIYCRTDHHWQPLGAYYAARTFADAAGVPFAELDSYEKMVNEGFVGTLYAFSGEPNLLNDPEDFVYYAPTNSCQTYYYTHAFEYEFTYDLLMETDTENSYLVFFGGDGRTIKTNTDVHNGRRLLVVKDSYGNAEVPFYTSSFEQIYVIDMRYFERNLVNFIRDMNITDVLFTMSSYSVVGENAQYIESMIYQDPDSEIVDGQLAYAQENSDDNDDSDGSDETGDTDETGGQEE